MEYYDCFAASYTRARAKFLKAAAEAKGEVRSFLHPDKKTPDGAPLAIDVACFGDRKATRQALFVSGTHGQEGFSGSAVQIGWMTEGGPAKLAGSRRRRAHGLPYGRAFHAHHREQRRPPQLHRPVRPRPANRITRR
jgi:hypothetical protein